MIMKPWFPRENTARGDSSGVPPPGRSGGPVTREESELYRRIRIGRAIGWACCIAWSVAILSLLASVLVGAR